MFYKLFKFSEISFIKNIFKSKSGSTVLPTGSPEKIAPSGQAVCGNDLCEPGLGETKENCPKDCTPAN